MQIYRLLDHDQKPIILPNTDEPKVVMIYRSQLQSTAKQLKLDIFPLRTYTHLDQHVRFETRHQLDMLSFIFFKTEESQFTYEVFSLYHTANTLLIVVADNGQLYDSFLTDFCQTIDDQSLSQLYLGIIESALAEMFDSLYQYERVLDEMENDIIRSESNYQIESIIERKNICFKMKKYMRLFVYISDDFLLNSNGLIADTDERWLSSLSRRINRLYDFSVSLYETCGHLMKIYDSKISTRTNDVINKLTVFTVFATPIIVLSGIYGMNFINMPELKTSYGYYVVLGVMGLVTLVIYFILKRIKLL